MPLSSVEACGAAVLADTPSPTGVEPRQGPPRKRFSSCACCRLEPKRLRNASTLCVLLGSATVAVQAVWRVDDDRGEGSSAELAAALLLMVSIALEALTFRRQHSGFSGFAAAEAVAGKVGKATAAEDEQETALVEVVARGRPAFLALRPPPQLVLPLLGFTLLMGGGSLLGGTAAVKSLGIVPRTVGGLKGILFGCFVHLSWRHCFWNIVGIVLLGCCAFRVAFPAEVADGGRGRTRGDANGDGSVASPSCAVAAIAGGTGVFSCGSSATNSFVAASAFIALSSGICVWCLARPAVHAGASGVVCGYFGLLVALTLRRRDVPLGSLLMVLAVVACYGGAALLANRTSSGSRRSSLYDVCASRTISSEHHTFGFLSGLASALIFGRPRSHDVPSTRAPCISSRSSH